MRKVLRRFFGFAAPLLRLRGIFLFYHTLLAALAARRFGFPGRKMIVVGVTGTNGKTTTCNLIHSILTAAGLKAGLISTVNTIIGGEEKVNDTKLTSLPPEVTQKLLAEMVEKGDQYAVLEVSSIALDQNRFFGVPFATAVFTNFTHDHLDYHRTMERYLRAKGKLFANRPKVSVVNLDDPKSAFFLSFPADKKVTYGLKTGGTQVTASLLDKEANSFLFLLGEQKVEVYLNLRGEFNLYNALAAAATAYGFGIPLRAIKEGLEKITLVPGRMEEIKTGQPFQVVVDYAHTPDGFEKVLSTLREITPGRLIAVFGATGERDKSKRPTLGWIASRYADLIILTEEDPGKEDPLQIINEVKRGIDLTKFSEQATQIIDLRGGKEEIKFIPEQNLWIIPDRREATKKAFSLAQEGDTVVLLGLGAQTVMVRQEGKVPYHEPTVAEKMLKEMTRS